ncbi:hypothetical protein [Paenibacillus larvae]|uniref:deoxynucleotide monophosphate kinase family protein n=1 Tax=Paenibacillus larvae TaxID=1464 RepID=UPI00288DD0FD|nr:hypothetical protein [Paenibacillus larvae]MDT2278152.1 hypothetical protein [Paenibacillus larvae]
MPTLPNIALTGKLRAGKDTVAEYLMERYGYARYAFGDGVKDDFHRKKSRSPPPPEAARCVPRARPDDAGEVRA